ncbi:MAG: curli-like amyloid fiber formation chaperone CsgH [Alphaproteobacteria bacterium]|nr:curli-like amyloid fiber formation chaperone CsgH [Alphaproteobacteria bacterium]
MLKRSVSLIALAALLTTACTAAAATNTAITTQAPLAPVAMVEPAMAAPAPAEAAFTPATYDSAPLTCEVRSRRTSNGVLIQARAFADRDIDASYDLRIVKSGGGNSSEVSQSGDFSLDAGSSATLGENEMSFERGSHLRAYLTISDARGELCQRTFRL